MLRESSKPGTTDIDLTLTFKTPNRIPQGSILTYYVALDQVGFSSSYLLCTTGTGTPLDCEIVTKNTTYIVLQVKEWCTPDDCPINSEITMKLMRAINPSTLDANSPNCNSFGVSIVSP